MYEIVNVVGRVFFLQFASSLIGKTLGGNERLTLSTFQQHVIKSMFIFD